MSVTYTKPNHEKIVATKIDHFRSEPFLTKITLKATDNQHIACHKCILMAHSNFFKSKLNRKDSESDVYLLDIPWLSEVLRMVVQFMYTGHIDINVDNVETIARIAIQWKVPSLDSACVSFIKAHLTTKNCAKYYIFATSQKLKQLRNEILLYVIRHYKKFVLSEDVSLLPMSAMLSVLTSKSATQIQEDDKLRGVIKWVSGNSTCNNRLILFNNINFNGLSDKYLLEIQTHPIIPVRFQSVIKKRIMDEMLKSHFQFLSQQNSHDHSPHNCPCQADLFWVSVPPALDLSYATDVHLRTGSRPADFYIKAPVKPEHLMMFSVFNTIRSYDESLKQWPDVLKIPENHDHCTRWHSTGPHVVLAGACDIRIADLVLLINIKTKSSCYLPKLPMPLNRPGVAVVDGFIYIFGGMNEFFQYLNKCTFRISIKNPNKWEVLSPMLEFVWSPITTHAGGYIFSFGGRIDEQNKKTLQFYDILRDQWTIGPDCPVECTWGQGGCITQGQRLSIVNATHMAVYDYMKCAWVELKSYKGMAAVGKALNAVLYKGDILVCGWNGKSNSIWRYTPAKTSLWTKTNISNSMLYMGTANYLLSVNNC